MKAVILAAGLGRRLAGMGWTRPKCLLTCPGGTLLDNMIESCQDAGIHEFAIVIGYRRELVVQAADRHDASFAFVLNAEFAETNTLYSLYLARDHLPEGFLLINGDVWFEPRVPQQLLNRSAESESDLSCLAVVEHPCGLEEVKVLSDAAGRITRIGKNLPAQTCSGEYVGIGWLHQAVTASLIERISAIVRSPGGKSLFYEAAIDDLLATFPFETVTLPAEDAVEIDTPEDYERARMMWKACARPGVQFRIHSPLPSGEYVACELVGATGGLPASASPFGGCPVRHDSEGWPLDELPSSRTVNTNLAG
jgi:choline kinase